MKKATKNEWIGKYAMFTIPIRGRNQTAFEVEVKILDVRQQYGREDYQVEPVAGRGKAWVQKKALRLLVGVGHIVMDEKDAFRAPLQIAQPILTPQEIEWQKFTRKK